MTVSRYVILSDMHVSAGALDDCDPEIEKHFCEFLNALQAGTELIINGDFLDFAQAPPEIGRDLESKSLTNIPLCFTEEQSVAKLRAIIAAHPAIFNGLGAFLARTTESRLTILPGNHDPDFFWHGVQNLFRCALGTAANPTNTVFHLEQVYRPIPELWVEHGHQHDVVNSFFLEGNSYWSAASPPIFDDISKKKRLMECIGTRFLIRYINILDREYPFIDNLKPFSLFLRLFAVSTFTRWDGPLKVLAASYGMLEYLATTAATRPRDFLNHETKGDGGLNSKLLTAYNGLSDSGRLAFDEEVERLGFPLNGRPIDFVLKSNLQGPKLLLFLAEHLDTIDRLESHTPSMMGATNGTLSLGPAYFADETAELKKAAKNILAQLNPPTCIVMGHTHEVVDDQAYKNTGSWTRYYDLRKHGKLPAWGTMRSKSYSAFPYRLNYLEAAPGMEFTLRTWASSGS